MTTATAPTPTAGYLAAAVDLESSLAGVLADFDLRLFVLDGDWILVQRRPFDLFLGGEPHHALQLYFEAKKNTFLVRIWGRTVRTGIADTLEKIETTVKSVFDVDIVVCVGKQVAGESVVFPLMPVPQRLSSKCKMIYRVSPDVRTDKERSGEGLCSHCKETEDETVAKLEDSECTKDFSSMIEVKMEEEGMDDEEDDEDYYDDDDEYQIPEKKPKMTRQKRKVATKVDKDDVTECDLCGDSMTHSILKRHKMQKHLWRRYKCLHCDSQVNNLPGDIVDHVRSCHPATLSASCPSCREAVDLGASGSDEFASHVEVCAGQRRSEICRKSKTDVMCPHCGKILKGKSSLKVHVLALHSDEEKKYKCDVCGYATHHKFYIEKWVNIFLIICTYRL
jgi:hypothetical protein